MISGVIKRHFERLQKRRPDAQIEELPDGGAMISVSDVALPSGWLKTQTTIYFVVLNSYPEAAPDCFWAEPDLKLANGGNPRNSGSNNIPHHSFPVLWFSWHITDTQRNWTPSRDDMVTYLAVIEDRLKRPE